MLNPYFAGGLSRILLAHSEIWIDKKIPALHVRRNFCSKEAQQNGAALIEGGKNKNCLSCRIWKINDKISILFISSQRIKDSKFLSDIFFNDIAYLYEIKLDSHDRTITLKSLFEITQNVLRNVMHSCTHVKAHRQTRCMARNYD